jgi:hypothetical protein
MGWVMLSWTGFGRKRSRYYPGICIEWLRKTTETLSQDSWCSSWDSGRVLLEYKSRTLPLNVLHKFIFYRHWTDSFHKVWIAHALCSYQLKLRSYDYFQINRGSTPELFRGHRDNHDHCPGLRALSETTQICQGLSAIPHLLISLLLLQLRG